MPQTRTSRAPAKEEEEPRQAPTALVTTNQTTSTSSSSSSPKKRKPRPVEPLFERKQKRVKTQSVIGRPLPGVTGLGRHASGLEEESDLRSRIGEKQSPGDGQLDYELTHPLPSRSPTTLTFSFPDYPDFSPNLSPEEIIRRGAFDGGYFRPVKSRKSGRELHEDWGDLPKEWYEGLDTSMYLTRPELVTPADIETSVNRWQAKMGQGYEEWEKNGWIVAEYDARGWFQWYYRFYLGRRTPDDDRQVRRWKGVAGEQSGRWRRIFLEKCRKNRVRVVDHEVELVSKGIRQTLNHWAYDPTTEDLNRFRVEKGEQVTTAEVEEAEAGEG
ncbi:hypothetical protein JCM11641_006270 [Rhodosporidiobolus odoratus]